jgi:diadenylate cyclase
MPLEWSDLIYYLRSGIEILIITVLIYYLLSAMERISAGGKLRGVTLILALVVVAWMIARAFQLHAITWLLQAGIGVSALVMAVVFQPELRRLFTRMGGFFPNQDLSGNASIIQHLGESISYLSSKRIGALIVFERNDRLEDYVASGPLDCEITSNLINTIFWKDTPLHDGAMIVRNGRIAAAGVILPLTNNPAFRSLSGTRHRAGIGISEDTDALVIMVSEETGHISMADRGQFTRGLTRQDVELILTREFRAGGRRGLRTERVKAGGRTATEHQITTRLTAHGLEAAPAVTVVSAPAESSSEKAQP